MNVAPEPMLPESKAPPLEVTVWEKLPSLVHWTLWPAVMLTDDGLKLKSTMETATLAVAEDDAVQVTGDADEVEAALDWVVEDEAPVAMPWVVMVEVGVEEDVGLERGARTYIPSPATTTTATTRMPATVPEIARVLNMA